MAPLFVNWDEDMIRFLRHEILHLTYSAHSQCSELRSMLDNEVNSLNSSCLIHHVNQVDSIIYKIDFILNCFNALKANELNDKNDYIDIFRLLNAQKVLLQEKLVFKGISFSVRESNNYVNRGIYVTSYFHTALLGILYKVLRSACFGSRIICSLSPDYLEFSYVGQAIPEDLINSVLNDHYGSPNSYHLEYGLYAAKRILDANGSFLSIKSEPLYERNIYAEIYVAKYLNSISEKERHTFVHNVSQYDYSEEEKIYKRIMNNRFETYEKAYLNTELPLFDHISRLDYSGINSLLDFEYEFIDTPISKTNITIYYGKAERYINN